jgi:glutamyl endopeptidase
VIVPPNRLPIIDRYVKESAVLTPEALRDELTTVTITPEGRVETAAPAAGEIEMLMRSLRMPEIAPQRPSGGQESAADVGTEDPPIGGGVKAESVIGQGTARRLRQRPAILSA